MRIVRLLALCALVASSSLFTACVSSDLKDIRVDAETNPKINLDGYKTYSWFAASAVVRDPDLEWTPPNLDFGAEVMRLVDNRLHAAGKVRVTTSPDMLVAYGVGVDMQAMGLVKDPNQEGVYRFERIPKSGLTVVLFDPRLGRAIWIGSAEADVREKPSAELVRKRLDYAIEEMFAKAF